MPSPICDRAIEDALREGRAILKVISPNDAGLTGAHQQGYYLPKSERAWPLFTPNPPVVGVNSESHPRITWQNGLVTESCVHWYGAAKREYRLTRFGRGFPYLTADALGSLLVLIPKSHAEFLAYVLDDADDTDALMEALGVETLERNWAVYNAAVAEVVETENECVERKFREFCVALTEFPTTKAFSDYARQALSECVRRFNEKSLDAQLSKLMESEYSLFKMAERIICQGEIQRLFASVDDFLKVASSVMNRRKSRAGRSLENHFEYILAQSEIPCAIRPPDIDGKPDVIIPSAAAYADPDYPESKLFMVGVKTTCKDRWRQVLEEAKRVKTKYILTLQHSISPAQLEAMRKAGVILVVPEDIKGEYLPVEGMEILTITEFVQRVKTQLAA
jgi:type II restriction enzyme